MRRATSNYHLFCNLYCPIYAIKIPKIFILLYLSDLTFASGREGIDNPFIALVARFFFVCVGTRDLRVASYWIDTLVLKNYGKYLRYFVASPFPLQGKTNACSRGSKKDFWRHCGGGCTKSSQDLIYQQLAIFGAVYAQVKTYQVPITNSYPGHYIIFHLPLVFLSPTSPLPFYSPLFRSSFSFVCVAMCLLCSCIFAC